jgi:hypothetical protein
MPHENEPKPNKLIVEKSPYLLQHTYNPVELFLGAKKHLTKRGEKISVFSYLLCIADVGYLTHLSSLNTRF